MMAAMLRALALIVLLVLAGAAAAQAEADTRRAAISDAAAQRIDG